MTSRANLFLFLLLACLWSGSFIGIKAVVDHWPPLFGAAMRVAIALLAITVLVKMKGKDTFIHLSMRWKLWVIGLFAQAIPFCFLFWGEQRVSPGLAGILNGTVPIWTFVFALIFMPRMTTFSFFRIVGLLVAMLGITIIFWPLLTFDNSLGMFLGAGAIVIMAMSYAVGNLLNQYLFHGQNKIDFLTNIYHQHWGSVTFLFVVSYFFDTWPSLSQLQASPLPWMACLYLGVCATALAFVIYYHLIREWDALRASSVLYIVPILTLVWDYLFFNNKPVYSEVVGVAAILLGVVLIQLANLKRNVPVSLSAAVSK